MASLEARVAAMESEDGCSLRRLCDAELEHRLVNLVAAATGRVPTAEELAALVASRKGEAT